MFDNQDRVIGPASSNVAKVVSFLLSLLVSLPVVSLQAQSPAALSDADRSRAAAQALISLYNPETGLFNTTGWWNSANAVTALADESRVTGDAGPPRIFPDILVRAPRKYPAFLNDFYDDEGWWALAWIDVYELNPNASAAKQYLETARSIFDDMAGGWDETCSGGIWWSKERKYKNAIANELFLSVAAKLALHAHGKQRKMYLYWADREWHWFQASGMINADSLVNDGLDAQCGNNQKTTWTYNQGVMLGGLAALSRSRKDPALLTVAQQIGLSAITHLTDGQGILHDPCEPDCGEDGVSFKGVFARNLGYLEAVQENAAYKQFLKTNASSLWMNARTTGDRFSTVWAGPPRVDNAGAQASALDALTAAAAFDTSPTSSRQR